MSKKNLPRPDGLVFSTNKDYYEKYETDEQQNTLLPEKQKLKVKTDSKQRAGKTVTLVDGFVGKIEDLEDLAKILKTKCGAGGSAKDNNIIIQGDYKDKVIILLRSLGYINTK